MAQGSSPLTRGKLVPSHPEVAEDRLIPAHAGKTGSQGRGRSSGSAHPRSRGENTADDALTAQPAGSSPLTRGKLPSRQPFQFSLGLIPAHAGKTTRRYPDRCGNAAHPRSRGENLADLMHQVPHLGSSPLTRGKHPGVDKERGDIGSSPLTRGKQNEVTEAMEMSGLIPAHAGKT